MKQNDCQLVTIAAQSEQKCREKNINQINDTIKVAYRLMGRRASTIHSYLPDTTGCPMEPHRSASTKHSYLPSSHGADL